MNAGHWFEDQDGSGYRVFGDAGVEILDGDHNEIRAVPSRHVVATVEEKYLPCDW